MEEFVEVGAGLVLEHQGLLGWLASAAIVLAAAVRNVVSWASSPARRSVLAEKLLARMDDPGLWTLERFANGQRDMVCDQQGTKVLVTYPDCLPHVNGEEITVHLTCKDRKAIRRATKRLLLALEERRLAASYDKATKALS